MTEQEAIKSQSNLYDKHQEIIRDVTTEINQKKDAIIMRRLEELGIKVDLKAEQRRRFKRFVVESNGQEETYWHNDGSETGLRIVTFKKAQSNFDLKEPNHIFITEVDYY